MDKIKGMVVGIVLGHLMIAAGLHLWQSWPSFLPDYVDFVLTILTQSGFPVFVG
jgi:hypothetical protein